MMKLMICDDSPSRRRRGLRGRAGSAGFTLVELLVVIAIIALLVSILLPALAAAKELANRSVCLSHLNTAGKAKDIYVSEHDGWLAGPNTSGQELSRFGGSEKIQDEDTSSSTPIQNMDWASPTLGLTMGFPENNLSRLVQILDADLKCPSNDEFYDGVWPDAVDDPDALVAGKRVGDIRYASYGASLGLHVLGADKVRYPSTDIVNQMDGTVSVPDDYVPKEEMIGKLAGKIYLMEGCRYLNGVDSVTFNDVKRQIQGGNFMVYGAATPTGGADPHQLHYTGALTEKARRYAWRHDDTMNALFLDGSARNLNVEESVDVNQYFPAGSTVNYAPYTQDPHDETGDVLH